MECIAAQQRLPPPGRLAQGLNRNERPTQNEPSMRGYSLHQQCSWWATFWYRVHDVQLFRHVSVELQLPGCASRAVRTPSSSACVRVGVRGGVDIQRIQKRRRGNVFSHRIGQCVVVLLQDRKLSNFGDSVGLRFRQPRNLGCQGCWNLPGRNVAGRKIL